MALKHFPVRLLFILLPLIALSLPALATIRFDDDVSPASMEELVGKISAAAEAGDRNITVELNSRGGNLTAALWAAGEMKKYNVNTSVYGECSSSCTILFAAGIIRSASYESTFMFHPVQVHEQKHAKADPGPTGSNGPTSSTGQSGISADGSVAVQPGLTVQDIAQDYSDRWLQAIRDASPALADILQKKGTLSTGRERIFTGRELRNSKYVND